MATITLPSEASSSSAAPLGVLVPGQKRPLDTKSRSTKRRRSSVVVPRVARVPAHVADPVGAHLAKSPVQVFEYAPMDPRTSDSILPPGMAFREPPILAEIEERCGAGNLSADDRRAVFGGRAVFDVQRSIMYVMLGSHQKPIMQAHEPARVENEQVVRGQLLRCLHIALRSIDTRLGFNLLTPVTFVLIDPPEAKTTTPRVRLEFMAEQIRAKKFKSFFHGVVVMHHECRQLGCKMDQRSNNVPVTTSGRTVRGLYHTLNIADFMGLLPRYVFHDQIIAMIVKAWGYTKYGQAKALPVVVPMDAFRDIVHLAATTVSTYYCEFPPSLAYETTIRVRGKHRPSHDSTTHTFDVETVRRIRHAYGLQQNDRHICGWLLSGDELKPEEDGAPQQSNAKFVTPYDLVRKLAIECGINRDPDQIVQARMQSRLKQCGASSIHLLAEVSMLKAASSSEQARVMSVEGGPSLPVFGTVRTVREGAAPSESVSEPLSPSGQDGDFYEDDEEDDEDDEDVEL